MKYVRLDSIAHSGNQFSHGFANTKEYYAVESLEVAKKIVQNSYDLTAKIVPRKEAIKHAIPIFGDRQSYGQGVEILDSDGKITEKFYRLKD